MRMKKSVKIVASVLLSVSALTACNKPEWMVKYQDEDPYSSNGIVTTVDASGNSIIGGIVDPRPELGGQRTSFIAKYNRAGQLLWDKRFSSNSADESLFGARGLLTDAQDNVYVAEPRRRVDGPGISLLVTKFDSSGQQLWQFHDAEAGLFNWKMQMYLDPSGNIYVRGGWIGAGHLLSISADGRLRWRAPVDEVVTLPGHTDLPEYPGVSTAFQSVTVKADFDWVMGSAGLRIIDRQANTIVEFTPASLALSNIAYVEIVGSNLVLIGENASNSQRAARLIRSTSSGFVFDDTKSLDLSSHFPSVDSQTLSVAGDRGICFATLTNDTTLKTGFIDADLNLAWTNTRTVLRHEFPAVISSVVGSNQACHTQYVESQDGEQIVSTVLVESVTNGTQRSSIIIDHFAAYDMAVFGKEVFQVGITGSYSEQEGTAATLYKKTIQ